MDRAWYAPVLVRLRAICSWLLAPEELGTLFVSPPHTDARGIEHPWLQEWDHLPRRSAGQGFGPEEYRLARQRGEEVARLTVGDEVWRAVKRDGHVDVPSRRHPGLTYRLRVGHRIEVLTAPGTVSPWPFSFLCVNPRYPLPAPEFFAHLYLYLRDNEEEVLRVAAPQPWDQELGRTF